MILCKSTAKEISFQWLHHLSTDSKVRATLHVSIIDSESEGLKKSPFFCYLICINTTLIYRLVTVFSNETKSKTSLTLGFCSMKKLRSDKQSKSFPIEKWIAIIFPLSISYLFRYTGLSNGLCKRMYEHLRTALFFRA